MKDREFRDYCAKRGLDADQTEAHVRDVRDFEAFLASAGGSAGSLDSAGAEAARDYLADLVARGLNPEERLLALARYGYATSNDILYIYLAGVLGGPRSGASVVRPGPRDSGESLARRRVCRPRIAAARLAP